MVAALADANATNTEMGAPSTADQTPVVVEAPVVEEGLVQQARELLQQLQACAAKVAAPFEWMDGPLVVAMKTGAVLLIDELNLAEDAVLERLNRYGWGGVACGGGMMRNSGLGNCLDGI